MGIFINLSISTSVTEDEWADVYKETLRLVDALPLAEERTLPIRGIQTTCLAKTKEREEQYGWNDEKTRTGWAADGDYVTLRGAERYYLPRDLVTDESFDPDAPDAMLSRVPAYLDYDWNDSRFQQYYRLWGAKTQGEPYHIYLLSVACLIVSRLGPKAYVYGDITKGQCRRAVELANEHLDEKIDIPDQCYPQKLLQRVKNIPFTETEKLKTFMGLYLGNKDAAFGDKAREYFSEKAFDEYWKTRFGYYEITTYGFSDTLFDYLLWGFDIDRLARFVPFYDKEGNAHYDIFVRKIMDSKLHLKEKDLEDYVKIDQEDGELYGVSTLFAQFALGGAKNRKVGRYIPIEEIRKSLISAVGDKCDVNKIIEEYLKKESEYQPMNKAELAALSKEEFIEVASHDPSAVCSELFRTGLQELDDMHDIYDIAEYEDLLDFKEQDSVLPPIAAHVGKYFDFCRKIIKEDQYTRLMEGSARKRCEWLVQQNRYLMIRDRDWDKIFANILDNPESFERYYPMVRVQITSDKVRYIVQAIAINDDLYQYVNSNYCSESTSRYGE